MSTTTSSIWTFDPAHTTIEFQVKHMVFTTVKGRFSIKGGTITDVADDPTRSSVEVEIDPASITTNEPQRDAHLRSADFFDVEKYPTMTFRSTHIEGTRERFKLTGDLSMHGQARPITFDVTFNGAGTNPYGKQVAGFSAQGRISRKEWGLNWNVALEAGGVLVSDEIKLEIEVQAAKQS